MSKDYCLLLLKDNGEDVPYDLYFKNIGVNTSSDLISSYNLF